MASVQQRGDKFTARYRDRSGKQCSAGTYDSRKKAQAQADAAEAIEKSGRDAHMVMAEPEMLLPSAKKGHVTIAGYGPQYLSRADIRDTTRESYGCMLLHVYRGLGTVPVKDLNGGMVRDFINGLEGTMSPATRGSVLTVLRALCLMARQDGILDHDPTAGIRVKDQRAREMTILTAAESRRILAAIQPRYTLLVRTMLDTGLRWGEAIALRPDDIVESEGIWAIRVRRTIAEVGGKQTERNYGKTSTSMRDVEIEAELAADLIGDVAHNGHIFTAARGGRLQKSNFRRIWLMACKAAGVKGVRVHDLRHTHASWLVNADWDESPTAVLIKVGKRLGHTDIKTTSRYLHVVQGNRGSVLDALRRAKAA